MWEMIKAWFKNLGAKKTSAPVIPIKQPLAPKPAPVISTPKPVSQMGEGTVPWYIDAYSKMTYDPGTEGMINSATNLVLSGKERYQAVEKETQVPWFVLGALHFKESSCDFRGVLHNGEHIIGTVRKTSIVPIGRGPFDTWHEAAVDAIKLNGARWAKLRSGSRNIGEILYACERFNGTGYLQAPKPGGPGDEFSPYLWACTSVNDNFGKYTRDHYFDPNAPTNKTVGVAAILKELENRGVIKLEGTRQLLV